MYSESVLNKQLLELLQQTFKHLGDRFLSTRQEDLEHYGRDWTKVFKVCPSLIVFPQSTEEVSAFLKFCNEHAIAVVPSGGRTGLAGGACATQGEVVLSLSRMNQIGSADILSRTLWCQAGAVTEAVHREAEKVGLIWPVDFASKGSSEVGGNIATNAGGVRVIRTGLTRQWVLGLTVVLMDGRILKLNGGLEKNNTGLDLRQCFIGTEGTLGVITEALLKLAPLPGESQVVIAAVASLEGVLDLFLHLRKKTGFVLNAFEFFTEPCLKRLLSVRPFNR